MKQSQTTNPAIRDSDEPSAGSVTVPIWLILIFGALFYWSQLYLSHNAGGFDEQVYAPFHSREELIAANPPKEGQEEFLLGQEVFGKSCVACHQPSGMGKEGLAPPLVGSEWVLAAGPNRIARIVLNGLSGPINVKGQEWNLAMVPWKDTFDDKQIAAVLTYVRNSWGNKATPVKPEQIAAARKEAHPGPMAAPELEKIPAL